MRYPLIVVALALGTSGPFSEAQPLRSCAKLARVDVLNILCGGGSPRSKVAALADGVAFRVDLDFVRTAKDRCGIQPESVIEALYDNDRPACPSEPPDIELFEAVPARARLGDSIRLTWRVSKATRAELEGHRVATEGTQDSPPLTKKTDFILRAFAADGVQVERSVSVDIETPAVELLPDGPALTFDQVLLLLDAFSGAGKGTDRTVLDRLVQKRLVSFKLNDMSESVLVKRGASRVLLAQIFAFTSPDARPMEPSPGAAVSREDLSLLAGLKVPELAISGICRARGISFELGPADVRMLRAFGLGDMLIGTLIELVNGAPAPDVRIDADPVRAAPGQHTRVSWDVRNAQSAILNVTGEVVSGKGSRTFPVYRDTDFSITGKNLGKSTRVGVSVRVVNLDRTSGTLLWRGDAVQGSEWPVSGLPGVPVALELDTSKWEIARAPDKTNDYKVLYLRSKKPGIQHTAEVFWRVAP